MHTRNAHCVPLVVVESMHRKWQADRSPHTLRLMPALRAMTPAPAMGAARKSDKPVRRGRRRKLPAFLRAQPAPPPRALAAALASSGDCVGTAAADTTAVADPPGLGKISKAPRPARRRAPGATHAAPQREATKRAAWRTTVPLSIPFGEVYAVSLQQPWASAVVAGAQPIVNRSVKLAIPPGLHSGVWLAVHADQATDECARCMEGADPALAARAARFPAMRSPLDLPRGRLIGAMRVVRCVALENRNALGADAAASVALRAGVSSGAGINEMDLIDIENMENEEVRAMLAAAEAEAASFVGKSSGTYVVLVVRGALRIIRHYA